MSGLLERLASGPLLADGAMGTLLYARGVPYDRSFDQLCISAPDLVRGVHLDYVAAGAELIETNTFGANAFRLEEHGLAEQVEAINRAGARLAVDVARAAGRKVYVAGSVGPLGVTLAPVGALSPARAREAYAEQIRALAAEGVDIVYLETMPSLEVALLALEVARQETDLPVAVSLTFGDDGTASGATPEEVALALEAAGADMIGANCSTGPAPLFDVAVRLCSATKRPVSVMPNAGLPTVAVGRYIYTSSPTYMAQVARQMLDAGVTVIGGCCGTTPEHIAALSDALRSGGGGEPSLLFPRTERVRVPEGERLLQPTRLQRAFAEDRFAVAVEVDPPNGFDLGALMPRLRALRDAGLVDTFDVADSPRAQARMSALALAALIQGELGTETVLHMACRHRNLVAVHSELLGAHALGVRNIFVVMGDLPAMGDYPDATTVRDITATGLMSLLAHFNRGVDAHGRALDGATSFHIGCAFNFTAADMDRELALLDKKIDAGAQFALTQPVYDPRPVEQILDRLGGRFPIPVLLGVLPLWNARHAAFLHHEVPGINVPAVVLERMAAAGDEGRSEGVAIAQEVLNALDGAVQGAYFMPPFGRYELCGEVLAGVAAGARLPASLPVPIGSMPPLRGLP